jgi:PAS domain S-box-containing protein
MSATGTSAHRRKQKHILLVEDERLVALSERRMIERYGFIVDHVTSGEQAVERALEDRDIDLVLMDIDLGDGIDGTEAAKRILAARSVPIVFLTGHSEREMVERVKGITRYGYVLKNSGEFVLVEALDMALKLFAAHRETRAKERRLAAAERLARVSSFEWDLEFGRFYISTELYELIGYTPEQLPPSLENALSLFPAEERETVAKAAAEDIPLDGEFHLIRSDGAKVPVRMATELIRGPDGTVLRAFGSVLDLRLERRTLDSLREHERALVQSRLRYETLVRTLPNAVVATDLGGGLVFVTERALDLFGYARAEEVLGLSMHDFVHPDERQRVANTIREWISGRSTSLDPLEVLHADGSCFYAEVSGGALRDPEGNALGFLVVLRDVTGRVEDRMERERLLEENRLLLREVYHRVKNDLNAVTSFIRLQELSSTDEELSGALAEARGRLQVMQRLYEKLSSRDGTSHVDLARLTHDIAEDISRAQAGLADVSVEVDVPAEPLERSSHMGFIFGIILNELLTNAYKYAFPEGAGRIGVQVAPTPEGGARLEVADDGVGFGGGGESESGVGLDLVRDLAESTGGSLSLSVEAGSRFVVQLEEA